MYCLVDCNNFFVSCERVFRPDLEGKPVVVLSNNDGCIVSRSNEAKEMGIPMGLPFFRLKEYEKKGKEPVVAFSSNYTLYGDLSSRVMSIVRESVGEVVPYSIDEMYYISDRPDHDLLDEAIELRRKILQWVGIPVSIGIAPTKTLAKVACYFAKNYPAYRGACAIDTEEKRIKALAKTPVGKIWGFGRRSAPKLAKLGFKTADQLVKLSDEAVRHLFSLPGLRTVRELKGIDCIATDDEVEARQSICTSRSFANVLVELEDLKTMTANFAAACAEKLRKQHSVASMVTVFVLTNRFKEDAEQYNNSVNVVLPVAVSSTQEIVNAAIVALCNVYKPGIQYKKCGVILSCISPEDALQLTLFDYDMERREKMDKLAGVLDAINADNGRDSIHLGSQMALHREEIEKEKENKELFQSNLRREHMSPRATTHWDEIIELH